MIPAAGRPAGLRPLAVALAGAAVAAIAADAGPARAQEAPEAGLDAVEAAADSGRLERARGLLAAWRDERASGAGAGPLAHADFLAARLATDADSARRLYARLAVEAGGEIAGRARLRLAQLHLVEGRPEPALRQLELVRSDFPGEALADEAWLWTGRARLASGDTSGACPALRRAAGAGGELRDRAARAGGGCGLDDPGDAVAAAPDTAADGAAGDRDAGEAAAVRWTVQLGAFRDTAAAAAVRERAREAGWEARRVPDGPDGLHRVRVGGWPDRSGAEEAARSLEEDGFRVLVVEARPTDAER